MPREKSKVIFSRKMSRVCRVYNFSKKLSDYEEIWKFQKYLQNSCWETKKNGKPTIDSLILVQHEHVYTLGRGATIDNVKFRGQDRGLPLFRIERGGEVTYHGPGQLVAYPIFDLDQHKRDLHWFSRSLEQTVVDVLKNNYQINADRSSLNAGVWIGNQKISAQGITASRWITLHGVSFNVTTDLSYYDKIIPCGLDRSIAGVCSLQSQQKDPKIELNVVSSQWLESFANIFQLKLDVVHQPESHIQSMHFSEPMNLERVLPII